MTDDLRDFDTQFGQFIRKYPLNLNSRASQLGNPLGANIDTKAVLNLIMDARKKRLEESKTRKGNESSELPEFSEGDYLLANRFGAVVNANLLATMDAKESIELSLAYLQWVALSWPSIVPAIRRINFEQIESERNQNGKESELLDGSKLNRIAPVIGFGSRALRSVIKLFFGAHAQLEEIMGYSVRSVRIFAILLALQGKCINMTCNKSGTSKCSKCGVARYCSQECQRYADVISCSVTHA